MFYDNYFARSNRQKRGKGKRLHMEPMILVKELDQLYEAFVPLCTTPGFRALDEPTSEVANRRSSTPKPSEGDQSTGQVSSGDELNIPWYAENDDGLEDMSDDAGDLDSETSSDMEEGSDLCFEAASDVVLGEEFRKTRTWREGGYYTRDDDTEDESDAPGEPDSSCVFSANESFLSNSFRKIPDREELPPQKEGKYIIFKGHLLELFRVCLTCLALCRNTTVVKGSLLKVTSAFATTFRVLKSLNIAMITEGMYYYYQSGYLRPVVKQVYERRNSELLEELRGKNLDLAGDGRCDSPGFCAKYCTYTFHEASTKKLIHIEQAHVPEEPSNNTMEKVAFLRGLAKLKDQGFTISSFMSDSYVLWTADMPPFQGAKRKLLAAGRSGPCRDLKVWVQQVKNHRYYCAALGEGNGPLLVSMSMSPLKHVINMHGGHDGPYYECLHQPLSDRAWLAVGTPAYEKLRSTVASPRLLKDIQPLSPGCQTYYVEAFYSLLIGLAFKSWFFSSEGMEAT
ncbi:hypothetical protein HPB47_014470 [Ixodes persulcatus]|uniref:Uncharacterized protein n=1 Tax=Ixodes persulcatus TaxID=34615 RepID=A0AC60QYG7_IXOPE|nr:hypothetical protein HPB47_014470 [Ixodes persulcatus]